MVNSRILLDIDFLKLGFKIDGKSISHTRYKKSDKNTDLEICFTDHNTISLINVINGKKEKTVTLWVTDMLVKKKSDLKFLLDRFRF